MGHIRSICTLNDLRGLDVINICNGNKLGNVVDVEIDLCMGCISAIILPKKTEFWDWFRKDVQKRCRIPWCQIERIGDDTILVRFEEVYE